MPYSIDFLPESQLAIIRLVGRVDGDTIRSAMTALIDDSRWQPGGKAVWDLHPTTALILEPQDVWLMALIAESNRERIGKAHSVIIAPSEEYLFIARMIVARLQRQLGSAIEAFQQTTEALQWIGVMPEAEALAI